jgi:divalent metal cation (Fe/Co/Zn/Cd) transporter
MGRKEKALMIAIGANLFLVALKFFLFAISGSMALQMSGWHSVQGLFVSLAVFLGLILSRKEENRLTRGISQIENVVALFISLFVFFSGVQDVCQDGSAAYEYAHQCPHCYTGGDFGCYHLLPDGKI